MPHSSQGASGNLSISNRLPPCAKCRHISCKFMHNNLAFECPLPTCDVCSDLADIDTQISNIYSPLLDLFQKRQNLINKMNHQHDSLTRNLPIEIVSLIFTCFDEAARSSPYYTLRNPILLGSVCKGWRAITLETPWLWTTVKIDLMKDCDHVDTIKEWLRRSRALPLHLTIDCHNEDYMDIYDDSEASDPLYGSDFDELLKVLRSHSARWKNLELSAPCSNLLNYLEDIPSIDMLTFHLQGWIMQAVHLREPLRPRKFLSAGVIGEHIPLQWDNLTYLEIDAVRVKNLLQIIRDAPKLTFCAAYDIGRDLRELSIPNTPTINHSLEHLETNSDILLHLTLPSLQYLHCKTFGSLSLDALVDFIKRSGAPLQTFICEHSMLDDDDLTPSFEELPQISELKLDYQDISSDLSSTMTVNFLRTISQPSETLILPRLQHLVLITPLMSITCWSLLGGLFPRDNQANVGEQPQHLRPLSSVSVHIHIEDPFSEDHSHGVLMDKDTFLYLLQVQESGVELDLMFFNGDDLLEHMADIYGVELPTLE